MTKEGFRVSMLACFVKRGGGGGGGGGRGGGGVILLGALAGIKFGGGMIRWCLGRVGRL